MFGSSYGQLLTEIDLKMTKLPISACIITLNEANNIADCIKSMDFVSEIIVLDSFSDDDTCKIAESLGAKVYKQKFLGHIEQKNMALSFASMEWVLALDADERLSPELKASILNIFQNPLRFDGYRFNRSTWYVTRWIKHGRFYPDKQLRLFRRTKAVWGGTNPHDKIMLTGKFKDVPQDILHYSYENIFDHVKTSNHFSSIQAKHIATANVTQFPILKMMAKSIWTFMESYFLRLGFLDGREGLIISWISSFSMLIRYAKVYEISMSRSKSTGNQSKHEE